jgi:hypothetical protein
MCLASASVAQAQNAPPPPTPAAPAKKSSVPLKVQVVMSRYDANNTKIESLPFMLSVSANETQWTTLNMQMQVAVPNTVITAATGGPTPPTPVTSYTYKGVGTSIACNASTAEDDRFSVRLNIEDSSLVPAKQAEQGIGGLPSFQSFNSSNTLILKDGQTFQYATATDPISGRVTKVEVTLTVVK